MHAATLAWNERSLAEAARGSDNGRKRSGRSHQLLHSTQPAFFSDHTAMPEPLPEQQPTPTPGAVPERIPESLREMARDFGLDLGSLSSFELTDVFKQGPASFLFITRVSQVYSNNHSLSEEVRSLRGRLEESERELKEARSRIAAQENTIGKLEQENDYLSSYQQNNVVGTVIFSLGSIAIGIAGSLLAVKDYVPGGLAGVFGVGMSILAAVLMLRKKKRGG